MEHIYGGERDTHRGRGRVNRGAYMEHKWSIYGAYMEEETHTQRAGARVNRGQAVPYTGTQKEIWDTFVLFAYLLALFSQSYVLTMIHHHYNSIYPIYISLLYIWQYQPSVLHKAHWLITNRRTQSLKLLNTHTTTPTTAHFGPKDQIPLSSPPKIAVSFGGKIYNVTLSRWRLTALKRALTLGFPNWWFLKLEKEYWHQIRRHNWNHSVQKEIRHQFHVFLS